MKRLACLISFVALFVAATAGLRAQCVTGQFIDPTQAPYGAVGDGATDDTAAFNAAIAAAITANKPLCVPPSSTGGISFYSVSNLAPITAPLTIIGAGSHLTSFGSRTGTGDMITLDAPNIHVQGIGLVSIIAHSSGALLRLTANCNGCTLDQWSSTFPYVAIQSAGDNVRISNGDIRFSSPGSGGSAGVIFDGGSGSTLSSSAIVVEYAGTPPSPLPVPDSGVSVTGPVSGLTISNVRVHNANVCFRLASGTGVTISGSRCNNAAIGVRAQPTVGAIDALTVDNTEVADTTANGMTFAGGTFAIGGITVSNSRVHGSAGYGVALTAGVTSAQVTGGSISGNGSAGVWAAAGVSNWSVSGATVSGNAGYGVFGTVGAGDFIRVTGNTAHANGTAGLSLGATGTHNVTADNIVN